MTRSALGTRSTLASLSTTDTFRGLHASGIFVMPNPWDRGSARVLEEMGFPALATTSAGLGRSLGKDDQQVTRDELVRHVSDLTAFISVPLNVDSERMYPEDPGGIARTALMLAEAGAAGCSIEDFDPDSRRIVSLHHAVAAVAEAAEACRGPGLVLTARAENHLYGVTDLDDTIHRLIAYADAGADVVYAPGLFDPVEISRVVVETGKPVNVLALADGPSVGELGDLGVRRVSTGSSLFNASRQALRSAAQEILGSGTSAYAL